MSVLYRWVCDRCGRETTEVDEAKKPDSIWINMASKPQGWDDVQGKHLCPQCVTELNAFLNEDVKE